MDFQELIDPMWFADDRTKTAAAMQAVCQRVPEDILDDLSTLFFAPSQIGDDNAEG